jgi:hypothetical protein
MDKLGQTWELVLRAVSDDYECLQQIIADVGNWSAERGIICDREIVVRALKGLIADDHVRAYLLSSSPPRKTEAANYALNHIDDLWFYVTPNGKKLADSFRDKWR